MLLMGDEVRRTQHGNNNAYCQDNDISWFDWTLLERHADIHRFVQALNAFRQRRDVVAEGCTLSLNQLLQRAKIEWHGVALNRPDWGEHSHSLALTLRILSGRFLLHGMFNAYWEPLTFDVPPPPVGGLWRRCIDTALRRLTTSPAGTKRPSSPGRATRFSRVPWPCSRRAFRRLEAAQAVALSRLTLRRYLLDSECSEFTAAR